MYHPEGRKTQSDPIRIRVRQAVWCPDFFRIVLETLAQVVRQEEGIEELQIRKEVKHLSLYKA